VASSGNDLGSSGIVLRCTSASGSGSGSGRHQQQR